MCGSQQTTLESQFCLSTPWVLEKEIRSPANPRIWLCLKAASKGSLVGT